MRLIDVSTCVRRAGWPVTVLMAVLMLGASVDTAPASAQTRDDWRFSEDELPKINRSDKDRESYRRNLVGIITGQPSGVYARLGADLTRLLSDRDGGTLRVSAIIGGGSFSNIDDLRNLHGVDFAVVQSDVLEAYERTKAGKEMKTTIGYVSRLHTEYLHIVTRRDVIGNRPPDVCVLDGKRINVGGRLSGTSLTARSVLQGLLGLDVTYDPSSSTEEGLDQLKARKVDAVAFVVGKPAPIFAKISGQDIADLGLELLAIPEDLFQKGCNSKVRPSSLAGTPYESGLLTPEDYGAFVAQGRPVPTIGVPSVLAAYDWKKGSHRYPQTKAFIEAFFDKAVSLGAAGKGYAPNWCGVDLGREVVGWKRVEATTDWIRDNSARPLRIDCGPKPVCESREALARQFDEWYRLQAPSKPLAGPDYLEQYVEFKKRLCS